VELGVLEAEHDQLDWPDGHFLAPFGRIGAASRRAWRAASSRSDETA
jgi:hypothetical protein